MVKSKTFIYNRIKLHMSSLGSGFASFGCCNIESVYLFWFRMRCFQERCLIGMLFSLCNILRIIVFICLFFFVSFFCVLHFSDVWFLVPDQYFTVVIACCKNLAPLPLIELKYYLAVCFAFKRLCILQVVFLNYTFLSIFRNFLFYYERIFASCSCQIFVLVGICLGF